MFLEEETGLYTPGHPSYAKITSHPLFSFGKKKLRFPFYIMMTRKSSSSLENYSQPTCPRPEQTRPRTKARVAIIFPRLQYKWMNGCF